jgi:hypothetical protein
MLVGEPGASATITGRGLLTRPVVLAQIGAVYELTTGRVRFQE